MYRYRNYISKCEEWQAGQYKIKVARVGTRREGYPDNDSNDFRLVFEVEFVKQLFDEYKPIELEIWHTYTDTTLENILTKNKWKIRQLSDFIGIK